jgi:hypothetical protein
MKVIHFQKILGLVIAVLMIPLVARAQTTTATVTGSVSDQSGAAIAGATVVLENLQTQVQLKAQTNTSGFYRVAGLSPGFYRASVTKSGFRSVIQDGVELHGQDEVALNYNLQVGSVNESITVTSSEPLLQSDSSTVSTVIEEHQIQNTPLNGRNVMNLSALTPGVVPQGSTSGNALNNQSSIGNYTNPAGWGNYQIGGAISGGNVTYVDGAPLNLPIENWMGFIPSQDSVQEFRVETNNISSEYGGYYGGVMNFTTKAGTNEIHGSAYEYFRNTVLDANDFFNNRSGVNRSPIEQNQYGLSAGGPLKKNKAFLYGDWEGYRNRTGLPYQTVVPTVAETVGDFTADAPIYYSGTTTQVSCNGVLNKVCPDSTALYMANVYKYWAEPNIANASEGSNNFATNASSGGSSNQYTFRGDYVLGSRQLLFGRYTYWDTNTLGTNYYHNNVPQPEVLSTTHQAVVGDTITLNSTTVADVHASYMRFLFTSKPPNLGKVDLSKFGSAYSALAGQVTYNALPVPYLVGYGSEYPLLIINVIQFYDFDKYAFSGNITKTLGKNALKFGGGLMRNEAYLSGGGIGPTGLFLFISGYPTTNIFANFMLGNDLPVSSSIETSKVTASYNLSQGYYVYDTFQASPRLTITGGVRWDLPGAVSEKHDVNTVLLPNIASPLGSIQNPATGATQQLKGNLALVNSDNYHSRNDDNLHYNLFAPNLGFSLRLLQNTVLRGGYGMSFISYTNGGSPSPTSTPIAAASTPATGLLSNPFPQISGILPQPVGRSSSFSDDIQGISITGRVPGSKYPNVQQWNLNVQHQLTANSVVQVGYQGSKGTHIQLSKNLNQLSDGIAAEAATQYKSLVSSGMTTTAADAATFVNQTVANPLEGKLSSGSAYNSATISKGQLLMPYPQFATSVSNLSANAGSSIYHSMQAVYQIRFHSAGALFAAYTWSKLIGNVDSTTGFLEGNTTGAIQDYNNLKSERSLESFDVPQRLVLNYSLALPIGKGQHWLANAGDGLNRVVGGWRASSITSFQAGYPIALTAVSNDLANSFGAGTIRPDRISACKAKKTNSAHDRLAEWFDTDCFAQPTTPFSFGSESRVDSELRTHGTNNWDLAFSKETSITERFRANFEAEFLNAFNRVQFAPPGRQLGGTNFGTVTGQLNNPRQIQFSLRLLF